MAARHQSVIVSSSTVVEKTELPPLDDDDILLASQIPRRPEWDATTTPEQLEINERNAFLEWRRQLARIEESAQGSITPFEKNLEVWRQLWRVVERSDVVFQVVDARNPLLF